MKIINVAMFCSSSDNIDHFYFDEAVKLADIFIDNNINLVYGAGKTGIMGAISRRYHERGQRIIGVIPKKLNKPGIVYKECAEIIETYTMSERKSIMFEIADAYIALPGGFGTLEEISEVITLKQLGYFDKPIAIFNTNKFYFDLISFFEKFFVEKYALETDRDLYFVSDNPKEVFDYIIKY